VMAPAGDFTFPDFNPFTPADGFSADGLPAMPSQIQTSQPIYAPSGSSSPQSGLISPQSGEKRKSDDITDAPYTPEVEDSSRVAAEEDKRRRNTAASARFRVKKKQREQALEKASKEMSDKVSALEGKINLLETENKWLKNLIMEKNENKDDIAALWKKYRQETAERKGSERKDGVGTEEA
jgi:hypothetical protein